MNRIAKHARFLHLLSEAKSCRQRESLLRHAKEEHLKIIREICLNLCAGNLPLSADIKKKVKRFAPVIRSLGNRKESHKNVRKTLVLKGGFLPLILPALLGLISTIGGRAIAKAIGV